MVKDEVAPNGHDYRRDTTRGTETILLVEDDTDVRIATRRLLERMGYRVLEASSPQAALDLTVIHRRKIDVVLSDIVMPGMNGLALAAAIRIMQPRVAVLYMSALGNDELVERYHLDERGISFIAKPFDAAELSAAVRRLLDSK